MVALAVDAALWWEVWEVSRKGEARVCKGMSHGYEDQAVNMRVGWLNESWCAGHE